MKQVKHIGAILVFAVVLLPRTVIAAPWIDPGDEQLRHHIQVLADTGVISTPITTWPLPWAAIAADIEQASTVRLSESQRWSLSYVKFYLQQAKSTVNLRAYAASQSDPAVLRDFGSDQREENELRGEVDWVGENLAGRLTLTWAPDATDGKDYRYDGSYVAGVLGNWALSVGAIDRWWGPAWQSSLILSSNARPVTAFSLNRQSSTAFETPWLSWIGPWTFTAFAGQLESDRAVPNAKLLGARAAFKPLESLEIGLSRTAQWGGDGRPQSWSSFWNAVIGNDNGDTEDVSGENDPSNQIGAIDIRWGFPLLNTRSAIYLQYAGEDESNGFPSRGMDLAGIETTFTLGEIFHHVALEYTDTMAGAHAGKRPNVAYEHATYQSGYRYFSRPLGSTFDNDTRAVTLLADHFLNDGSQISWRLSKLALNRDQSDRENAWGGGGFQSEDTAILAEFSYSLIIKSVKISTSVYNVGQEFQWNGETIQGTGFGIAVEYKSN